MLRPRLIPCLLVKNRGLVKTIKFDNPKYVGDPLNAVRIFNEKVVDELVVLDIDATKDGREPDYKLISRLANECRMPLCYGGGVRTVKQINQIVGLGVEKVALGTAAVLEPELIVQASKHVGRQSIVAVMDVKRTGLRRRYEVVTENSSKRSGWNPVEYAKRLEQLGVGEILVNSVDRDGTMEGYDIELIRLVRGSVNVPVTVLGGAGTLGHVSDLIREEGIIGAAAGSLFVFKGKYRAVLINYPNAEEKAQLFEKAGWGK